MYAFQAKKVIGTWVWFFTILINFFFSGFGVKPVFVVKKQ
jgi:hypothetical protein